MFNTFIIFKVGGIKCYSRCGVSKLQASKFPDTIEERSLQIKTKTDTHGEYIWGRVRDSLEGC